MRKQQVYIGWSGKMARQFASLWTSMITECLDDIEPMVSDTDIGTGEVGLTRIADELKGVDVGLLLVTPQNFESHWLTYLAGALTSEFDNDPNRLLVSTIGMSPSDLGGPLGRFRSYGTEVDNVEKLVLELADFTETDTRVALNRFDRAWHHEYEEKFHTAAAKEYGQLRARPDFESDTSRALQEILAISRETSRSLSPMQHVVDQGRPRVAFPTLSEAIKTACVRNKVQVSKIRHRGPSTKVLGILVKGSPSLEQLSAVSESITTSFDLEVQFMSNNRTSLPTDNL